jgi:hypothetical protein
MRPQLFKRRMAQSLVRDQAGRVPPVQHVRVAGAKALGAVAARAIHDRNPMKEVVMTFQPRADDEIVILGEEEGVEVGHRWLSTGD